MMYTSSRACYNAWEATQRLISSHSTIRPYMHHEYSMGVLWKVNEQHAGCHT